MHFKETDNIKAVITSCNGLTLSNEEKEIFKKYNPLGLILFQRNCANKQQIIDLIQEFKKCVNRDNVLILIDQEGGRVARLEPPIFSKTYSAYSLANFSNIDDAKRATYLQTNIIANELNELGINVNCAPDMDLLHNETNNIIANRSFGSNPNHISTFAQIVCDEYLKNNIIPIAKHIPGHGRATIDSHLDTPIVNTTIDEMKNSDFIPFKNVNFDWAMTAHIIYKDIDQDNVATLSNKVINFIRENLEFDGILISDDIAMHALTGSFTERTKKLFNSGCDILLNSSNNINEQKELLDNANYIDQKLCNKLNNSFPKNELKKQDIQAMKLELEAIIKKNNNYISTKEVIIRQNNNLNNFAINITIDDKSCCTVTILLNYLSQNIIKKLNIHDITIKTIKNKEKIILEIHCESSIINEVYQIINLFSQILIEKNINKFNLTDDEINDFKKIMDIVILQYSIFANSSDVNSMDILLQNEEELSKILLQLSNDLQNSFLI